jgi:hypothetical protein
MTTGAVEARKSPLRSPLLQRGEARSARGICARGNVWNVYSVRGLTAIYSWVDGCRAQGCHGQASCPCPTSSAGEPIQCCPGIFPSSGSGLVLLPFGVREPRSRFCQAKPRFACSRPEAMLQANKAPAWLAHSTIAPPSRNEANLFRTVLGPAASGTRPIGTWGLFFLLVPAKENCSKLKPVRYASLA